MSLCSHVCHRGRLSIYLMQFVQQSRGTSVNPAECRPASATSPPRPRAPAESHRRCCTTLPRYEGINTCLHSTAGLMRNCSKPLSKSLVTNSLAGSTETVFPSCGKTSHLLCPRPPPLYPSSERANMIAYVCTYSTWPHESVRICMCATVCVIITYPKL